MFFVRYWNHALWSVDIPKLSSCWLVPFGIYSSCLCFTVCLFVCLILQCWFCISWTLLRKSWFLSFFLVLFHFYFFNAQSFQFHLDFSFIYSCVCFGTKKVLFYVVGFGSFTFIDMREKFSFCFLVLYIFWLFGY